MAAFREAIRANKGIELDVHLTKDKKIAVFHDDSLKRMCKVSGTIEEKTWEELKKLRLLETAEPIPLLEDVPGFPADSQNLLPHCMPYHSPLSDSTALSEEP